MSGDVDRPAPQLAPIAAPPEPDAIALGTGDDTADRPPESWFALAGQATVRNVGRATLTPVLPARGTATGAAVVVAAGGGYLIEAMDNEAWPQARWLAARGIAAFVLKYRLEPTPADPDIFARALVERFTRAADPAQRPSIVTPAYMVEDAAAALAHVRADAATYGIDRARIGYLGFSAGAMIGLGLVDAAATTAALPAFLGAIYPSMATRPIRPDAPPLFAAMAADDQLYGRQGYALVQDWIGAGRPAELHVYGAGGHGFGMGMAGTTSTGMMDAFHRWLACGGWLGAQEGDWAR